MDHMRVSSTVVPYSSICLIIAYFLVLNFVSSGSSGGVVVPEQAVRRSIPGLAATISEIGYLLLPKSDDNPQNNQPTLFLH